MNILKVLLVMQRQVERNKEHYMDTVFSRSS